jgi:predicted CXXCH cytochrome family protein
MKTFTSTLRPFLLLAALTAAGCQDTEKIFVAFPLYDDPPTAAAQFLGYSDQDDNLPVCGNCHVGQNAAWQQTAHAGAWETLQASPAAQDFCEGCHTVSESGNHTEDPGGWTATLDTRYQDVQCESCHGPGLEHVINPDASQPLASLLAGTDLTNGCGECHAGSHHGFVDEWAESRHGTMNAFPQGREECVQCHEARGALAMFGVKADYIEKEQTDAIPITCAVCHDPHDATNQHQLRFPIDVPNVELNLCMKCHHKRAVPDPNSSRGPHSPQGPLLMGEAGWRPPNFLSPTAQIVATHGTAANPGLCAGCHVNSYEVTDPESGDHVFSVTGHSFKATPCLDVQGVPLPTTDCAVEERTFAACSSSGCHGTPEVARGLLLVVTTRLDLLADELDALLVQVPASEFVVGDDLTTTGEGAKFNLDLATQQGSPFHNPFLIEALLTASIQQVELDYGVSPSPALLLVNVLESGR